MWESPVMKESSQNGIQPINITINSSTGKNLRYLSKYKRWEYLAARGHVPLPLERASFHLMTMHDYVQALLHHIGLASDKICPLCRTFNMDGHPLQTATISTNYLRAFLLTTGAGGGIRRRWLNHYGLA
ncbi:hypothetical protein NPIL_412671 [Nephila pilipes]|uniref:Uncharacterized protein n=1 Tax=Nephila pilipes TaxID=299642 RepID=A0A8X6MXA7_NEPPI|nr:hypothetical protein NPIL_412671 [Nephila pilipes]